jgi:cytochrome c oxidase subunit IV
MNNNNSDDASETGEDFLETNDQPQEIIPERHGCVTAWLILMLVLNSVCSLLYLIESNLMERKLRVSFITIVMIVIIGTLNAIFSIMLLYWKKAGFYGFLATTIVAFVINYCIKLPLITTLLGLCGIGILFGILQIKKGGRPAWYYLK